MKFKDILTLTFKNLGFKGLRSWLTIIGIVIGIASVVGLMTFGESINDSIENELNSFGSDNINILPGGEVRASIALPMSQMNEMTESNLDSSLTDNDVIELSKLDYVEVVTPVLNKNYFVEFRGEMSMIGIFLTVPETIEIIESGIEVEKGSMLNNQDTNKVVLGYKVANDYFNNKISVGDSILIKGFNYRVKGILEEQGGMFLSSDDRIIMNINEITNFIPDWDNNYDNIQLKVISEEFIDELIPLIEKTLRRTHRVNEGDEDFRILDNGTILEKVKNITSLITVFLTGISIISLIVGAVSISNTMFTSVYERTREIGIMKAIGADNQEVMMLFITESIILSVIGGIGGIILGLGIAKTLTILMPIMSAESVNLTLNMTVEPSFLALSLIFSIMLGVLSGYFPAKQAAGLNPIEAIWHE